MGPDELSNSQHLNLVPPLLQFLVTRNQSRVTQERAEHISEWVRWWMKGACKLHPFPAVTPG